MRDKTGTKVGQVRDRTGTYGPLNGPSEPKPQGLGRETVRKLVKDDPGVIKIRMGRKKAHTVYSVPESAAQRIHTRLLNPN